jgi:cytochrome c oxidase assembly factor CtaG
LVTLLVFNVVATPDFAHGAGDITPATWARAWSWEPGIVASLFASAALYAAGLHEVRVTTGARQKLRREAFYFWSGWALLVIALISPIHPLGQVLFSAHMVQHELLMVAAAPLLVLGRPARVWLWALPRRAAKRVGALARTWSTSAAGRRAGSPFVAFIAHAAALWVWHVPRYFEATLDSDALHAFQHACFLGTALWFWDTVFFGPRRRAGYGMAVVYLFLTALHSGALGALITFARAPWYPRYAASAALWAYRPLEDQQLGGLIMWVPAGLSYIVAALALFAAWLRESDTPNGNAVKVGADLRAALSSSDKVADPSTNVLEPSAARRAAPTSIKCAPSA